MDQYLQAQIDAPAGSHLAEVVEKHLTDAYRREMTVPPGENPEHYYAYVSGWSFGNSEPTPLFKALVEETGITPTEESPWIGIFPDGVGGYRIEPCVMYWRKANAVHRWFVENCQDGIDECQRTEIDRTQLRDLVERCASITERKEKVSVPDDVEEYASETLPTTSGFFFGGTDYDEWYYSDVKATDEALTALLANPQLTRFVYHSSW